LSFFKLTDSSFIPLFFKGKIFFQSAQKIKFYAATCSSHLNCCPTDCRAFLTLFTFPQVAVIRYWGTTKKNENKTKEKKKWSNKSRRNASDWQFKFRFSRDSLPLKLQNHTESEVELGLWCGLMLMLIPGRDTRSLRYTTTHLSGRGRPRRTARSCARWSRCPRDQCGTPSMASSCGTHSAVHRPAMRDGNGNQWRCSKVHSKKCFSSLIYMKQGILNSEVQWIHLERRPSFIHCILLDTLVICVEPPNI